MGKHLGLTDRPGSSSQQAETSYFIRCLFYFDAGMSSFGLGSNEHDQLLRASRELHQVGFITFFVQRHVPVVRDLKPTARHRRSGDTAAVAERKRP